MQSRRIEAIANQIVEMIGAGDFDANNHLNTMELAARFGVSRTPIRQALDLIALRGLVELQPNKGYYAKQRIISQNDSDVATPDDDASQYYRLADDWLNDRIPEHVSESLLRSRYGLSRAEVAAILTRAAEEGWAEHMRGYGWRLLPVVKTSESFEAVYRFRSIVEPAALLEPTFHIDRDVINALRRVQQSLLDGDIERLPANRLLLAGIEFHERVMELCGNTILLHALKHVNRLRRLIEYRSMIDRGRLYKVCSDHLMILDSIESGDNLEAAHQMRLHLSGTIATKSPIQQLFGRTMPEET